MNKKTILIIILLSMINLTTLYAKDLKLEAILLSNEYISWDSEKIQKAMIALAEKLTENNDNAHKSIEQIPLFSLSGQHKKVLFIIDNEKQATLKNSFHYQIYSQTKLLQIEQNTTFNKAFAQQSSNLFKAFDDNQAFETSRHLSYELERSVSYLNYLLKEAKNKPTVRESQVLKLLSEFQRYKVYSQILKPLTEQFNNDLKHRYIIDEDIIIKTPSGATISALMVRKKGLVIPLPTALSSNIYSDLNQNRNTAIEAALHGYVGFVADTRGKRLSPDLIEPFEHDGVDTHAVIDWISKQKWSDGQVGMYGGSYSGFVQWAAAKYHHPALKTIVPYVAAIPGQGLPMENNIFLTANYAWNFYVTNNKYLDNKLYNQNERWQNLNQKWYLSGRSFREIDQVDGLANPWLQKHLNHPSYDEYWQQMVPYKKDYTNINIPVLSFTGYYDDGQISALHYLSQHEKYNKNANHYLVIGPYDHFGSQSIPANNLRGYQIDKSAKINIKKITFEWLDYILKKKHKPSILKDKINYQLMAADQWLTAKSFKQLNTVKKRFYFTEKNSNIYHQLNQNKPRIIKSLKQQVDFKERSTSNNQYYPWPIINEKLNVPNGLAFSTEVFDKDFEFSGLFSGKMKVKINKVDFDLGITVYEILPDGKVFHLAYFIGRASYAKDMSKRNLLRPGKIETVVFERSRMAAKLIKKGSRIVVLVNVNKNSGAQINYGTGDDVSNENIKDAEVPLNIEWFNNSYIDLPLKDTNRNIFNH
jgi:putative CocE/NonD family hydrolase